MNEDEAREDKARIDPNPRSRAELDLERDIHEWQLEDDEVDYRERLNDGRLAGQVAMEQGAEPDDPFEPGHEN